ncbi:MAG TPA: universal stress protein [Streptosporangiaceae bacterium]|nr:universal stress protein [Streptosporangiaceae bacterium]
MVGTAYGILAGYDGSPGSEQALSWAVREARSRGTALTVCCAYEPGFAVLPGEEAVLDLARRSGERIIDDGLRRAQHLMGAGKVRSLLVQGQAATVLCEHSHDADIVVVGSRGIGGGVAGRVLGSVSSQVAAHAKGRVVVVRGHWRPAAGFVPGPVVVGANGSPPSRAALDFAFEEATLREAPVLAVCALADAPGSLGGHDDRREQFEHAIRLWEKKYPEVTVLRRVAVGGARDALLTAARDAQMLVVGSRGRGGVPGMVLGSISQAALHHAPCPVGVVHPA